MAVLTAKGIANVAIPLLSQALVLPRTFTMVPVSGFAPPNGETVTVRVRAPRTAREQTTAGAAITYDDQNEIAVDVSLKHKYDAYHVTDEDQSLALEDFASQITEPQVKSVAEAAELTAYTEINGLAADASFALTASASDTKTQLQTARETLSNNKVPASDRWFAAAPNIITRLLNVDEFVRADALGDGQSSALREGVVGRVYGFNVIEAPGLTDGTAVAYHRSGFVFATKKPEDPRGAKESFAISDQGINIRQIFHYDPDVLSDASVLSTFAGTSAVYEDSGGTDNDRFYKLDTATA